jgi:two-component sensor histidine kinase
MAEPHQRHQPKSDSFARQQEAIEIPYDASTIKPRRPMVSRPAQPPLGKATGDAEHSIAEVDIDLRQLRHHTKNALQRIIGLITELPGLHDTPAGEKVARELEHRIVLSATISNALFGLTDAPASIVDRLRQLGGAVVDMMRAPDQAIRVGVSVRGCCPPDLREAVIRCANELIGNAVKHGMKGRPTGRIAVRLVTEGTTTTLSVVDNGWGFSGTPRFGEGLSLAQSFAERHGGSVRLESADGTVAIMDLKH